MASLLPSVPLTAATHWILFIKKGSLFSLKISNTKACVCPDEYKHTLERRTLILERRRWVVTGGKYMSRYREWTQSPQVERRASHRSTGRGG